MTSDRQRLIPVFRAQISSAEVMDDEGSPFVVVKTETEQFEFPMHVGSRVGFRADLIGHEIVIGLLPPKS
jgi:hypothetical protein